MRETTGPGSRLHSAPRAIALLLFLCLPLSNPTFSNGLTYNLVVELKSPNEEPGGRFGRTVGGVPDVNGDGIGDVVVGARNEDAGEIRNAGRAYLFDGSNGELIWTFSSPNPEEGGRFGNMVSGLRDMNGNGSGDVFVGTSGESIQTASGERPTAYIFDGATGEVIHLLVNPSLTSGSFGASITELSDTNDNGADDFAIGSSSLVGNVDIFDGATGKHLKTFGSPTPSPSGAFGSSVASIQDLNSNGFADLIVGAPQEPSSFTDRGRAYVIDGKTGQEIHSLQSPVDRERSFFGESVVSLSDFDGDNIDDIVIGAWGERSFHVFSGSNGSLLRTVRTPNNDTRGAFGAFLDSVSRSSLNPFSLILVGAEGERGTVSGRASAGNAYIYNSATLELLQILNSPNPQVEGDFAQSVSFVPDANGDLVPDIVIGTEGESPGDSPSNAGRAYIFHSRNPEFFLDDDRSDINEDGKVDSLDLEILLTDWQKVSQP